MSEFVPAREEGLYINRSNNGDNVGIRTLREDQEEVVAGCGFELVFPFRSLHEAKVEGAGFIQSAREDGYNEGFKDGFRDATDEAYERAAKDTQNRLQKEHEKEMKRLRSAFNLLVIHMSHTLTLGDNDGDTWNTIERALDLIGLDRKDVLGEDIESLDELGGRIRDVYNLKGGELWEFDIYPDDTVGY